MTIEVMVFGLWIAAMFLVLWQIIISIQFSRMSGSLKLAGQNIEEGWDYDNLELLCHNLAVDMMNSDEVVTIDAVNGLTTGMPFDYAVVSDDLVDEQMVLNDQMITNDQMVLNDQMIANDDMIMSDTVVIESTYLSELENRIDTLETTLNETIHNTFNMNAGHFANHVTQYGCENTGHSYKPAGYGYPNGPVRLKSVR